VLALLLTGRLGSAHAGRRFLHGLSFPFIMPARQAIVANIVGARLGNAMALQMGGMNAHASFWTGGCRGIVAFTSVKWVYVMAVILYVGGPLSMSRISKSPPEGRRQEAVMRELVAG
jgi:hypothetical protein